MNKFALKNSHIYRVVFVIAAISFTFLGLIKAEDDKIKLYGTYSKENEVAIVRRVKELKMEQTIKARIQQANQVSSDKRKVRVAEAQTESQAPLKSPEETVNQMFDELY